MSKLRTNRIEDLQGNPLWDKDDGILGNVTTSTGTQTVVEALDSRVNAFTPEMFDQSGGLDYSDAIEDMLQEAAGRYCVMQSGKTYPIGRALIYEGNVNLSCSGEQDAIIFQNGQGFNPLTIKGGFFKTTTLSEPKEIGDSYWRVNDSAGVTSGMLFEVVSSESWYYDPRPTSTDARKSELHKVLRVTEDGIIVTELPANDGYPTSETVTCNIYAPATVNIRGVKVKAMHDSPSATARRVRGITLETVLDGNLLNVSTVDCALTGVTMRRCYNTVHKGGLIAGVNGASESYASQVVGSTKSGPIGVDYVNCYAAADITGFNVISLSCFADYCTMSGGGVASDGTPFGWGEYGSLGNTQRGHGSHGPSDKASFRGNRFYNLHTYFVCRGRNIIISENEMYGRSRNSCIALYYGENAVIRNNTFDPSFFGGKNSSTYAGANINSRLPDGLVRIYDTWSSSVDNPTVITGNTGISQERVVEWVGNQTQQTLIIKDNSFRMRPIGTGTPVYLLHSESDVELSRHSQVSVGQFTAFSSNTPINICNAEVSLSLGAKLFEYSQSPSLTVSLNNDAGGPFTINMASVVFSGEYATCTVSVSGISPSVSDGTNFSITLVGLPFLDNSLGTGNSVIAGTVGGPGITGYVSYSTSQQGAALFMQKNGNSNGVVRAVFTYPVGGTN